jgi:hypothetical protein
LFGFVFVKFRRISYNLFGWQYKLLPSVAFVYFGPVPSIASVTSMRAVNLHLIAFVISVDVEGGLITKAYDLLQLASTVSWQFHDSFLYFLLQWIFCRSL